MLRLSLILAATVVCAVSARRIGSNSFNQVLSAADATSMAHTGNVCFEGDGCRFPVNGFSAPVTESAWNKAMKESFGDDILTRTSAQFSPAESSNPVPHLAMSLTNLRNVRTAVRKLADASSESAAQIKNTNSNPKFGGGDTIHWTDVTMHLVNGYIVSPLLRQAPTLSFVEVVGGGEPAHFISHSWGGRFASFVHSVEAHFKTLSGASPDTTYYWVCTFANRQLELAAADSTIAVDSGPFARALEVVKENGGDAVAVQDDAVENEMSFARVWCAFEMYKAMMAEVPIKVVCSTSGILVRSSDGHYHYTGGASDPNACTCKWKKTLKTFSVATTAASKAADKTAIIDFMNTAANKGNVCKGVPGGSGKSGEECLNAKVAMMVPEHCYGTDTTLTIGTQGPMDVFAEQFRHRTKS